MLRLSAADLEVAELHTLLGDLAREIGSDRVKGVDLIGPNGDPHHFEPNPEDLRKAGDAQLYLVAGMGLEGYLSKLRSVIAGHAELVEVGATPHPEQGLNREPMPDPNELAILSASRKAAHVAAIFPIKEIPEAIHLDF